MSDLKPCPFCGGPANGVKIMKFGAVMCDSCGYIIDRNSTKKAVEAWNTRAADPRVQALVEAAKPFAKGADGRRCKDIRGMVCFDQTALLAVRAALAAFKEAGE